MYQLKLRAPDENGNGAHWDNPYLLGSGPEAWFESHLPDNDTLHVDTSEPDEFDKIAFSLTTNSGNWWRSLELYEAGEIRIDQGTAQVLEMHAGAQLQKLTSENGSIHGVMRFGPTNQILVLRKAKFLNVHTVMYVGWMARRGAGPNIGRRYDLRWQDL